MHGAAVRMVGLSNPVNVFSGRPMPIAKGDRVVVLGSIVREPAKNLAGYQGPQPVVVWAGLAIKLP